MKFLLYSLFSVVLISQSYSQLVPLIPPAFAPLFAPNLPPFISALPPLPLRLGPGLPGVPVFPHLGPLPVPAPGPVSAQSSARAQSSQAGSNVRSGRSIEESIFGQNRSLCSYVSAESSIRCVDGSQRFECSVEARLDEIRNITVRLSVLRMVQEVDSVRLVSQAAGLNSTFIHPVSNEPVKLSIFSSSSVREPGFFVREARCMEKIESLVRLSGVEGARFSLFLRV